MMIREQLHAERIVYVGDETRDIEACQAAGIPVIAVSWGLNRRELLASLSPDQIADRPEELPDRVRQVLLSRAE
ncbi:MAG: HAD hydrolase-like protein [Bacteroidales bacterium]|nr:HAD hydrolase-like protein [Bacteroidales bacterium]